MTVSRALRYQSPVSEATRATILAKAGELGYVPDLAFTALVHYRHQHADTPIKAELAWIDPCRNPARSSLPREFEPHWRGAVRSAERLGFRLTEFRADHELSPDRLAGILFMRKVQGVILLPGSLDAAWIKNFPWDRFSLVGFSRAHGCLPVHEIAPDQAQNTLLALGRMAALGYRRIGLVSGPRRAGIFDAGLRWVPQWLSFEHRVSFCELDSPDAGENPKRVRSWFAASRPDAILTDFPGLPALLAAMGLRIPLDVALAGLTVLDGAASAGIYQNPGEVGRVAALTLASLINDHDRGLPPIPRRTLIPGRWIDGPSLPRVP